MSLISKVQNVFPKKQSTLEKAAAHLQDELNSRVQWSKDHLLEGIHEAKENIVPSVHSLKKHISPNANPDKTLESSSLIEKVGNLPQSLGELAHLSPKQTELVEKYAPLAVNYGANIAQKRALKVLARTSIFGFIAVFFIKRYLKRKQAAKEAAQREAQRIAQLSTFK